jgi:hypothetical protein
MTDILEKKAIAAIDFQGRVLTADKVNNRTDDKNDIPGLLTPILIALLTPWTAVPKESCSTFRAASAKCTTTPLAFFAFAASLAYRLHVILTDQTLAAGI